MYNIFRSLLQSTRGQWQKVLFICAGIGGFGALFFLLFASGEEQSWNRTLSNKKETNSSEEDEIKPLVA